jgi:hypothetical protein
MITRLDEDSNTRRAWNGRDDVHQHYLGRVPRDEKSVSLSLTWKKEKDAKPSLVGRFVLDVNALAKEGFVREVEGFYILRFQRTGNVIEIAPNRSSPALKLARLPSSYA